jgi:hypothetical protein
LLILVGGAQVEITVNLIAKAMKQSGKTKFLVDGFPRNQDNMDGWNKVWLARLSVHCLGMLAD